MGGEKKKMSRQTERNCVEETKVELCESFASLAAEADAGEVTDESYERAVFALKNGKAILQYLRD